jgi:hypothetical protein
MPLLCVLYVIDVRTQAAVIASGARRNSHTAILLDEDTQSDVHGCDASSTFLTSLHTSDHDEPPSSSARAVSGSVQALRTTVAAAAALAQESDGA